MIFHNFLPAASSSPWAMIEDQNSKWLAEPKCKNVAVAVNGDENVG